MAETIIPAQPEQRIWVQLSDDFPAKCDWIDVIAWSIGPSGPPVPITVAGRLDKGAEFILQTAEYMFSVLPEGRVFHSLVRAEEWLRTPQGVWPKCGGRSNAA
jgi:hypothetical protein